jgi:hypothetical protein
VQKKYGGKLVGPARAYLREWVFDEHGLVLSATCEADRFIAGFDLIAQLHPRIKVSVTSLRKKTARWQHSHRRSRASVTWALRATI